jgi:heterodisulfide reductase subunit A
MKRIGVFVCWCGHNIAGTVDVTKVVAAIKDYPGVVFATDYVYVCSEPGQEMIRKTIKEQKLDAVVVSSCSPTLHETTFRRTCAAAGLNPFQCEIANIREQVSWVTDDKEQATQKAIKVVKTIIEKVRLNESLNPIGVPLTKRALVIGGGVAGIQAALDIANSGNEVILLEKEPSIGGHMAQLSETFPTLDCSQCILTPRMVEVRQHQKIKLLTYSEVEDISGYVGNFKVKIRQKARSIDPDKCTGCGVCWLKCPKSVPSEFDRGLGKRKAIYVPFPQAVPNLPVIDRVNCIFYQNGKCRVCERLCEQKAINFAEEDTIIEEEVGSIVVATGFELYSQTAVGEYGYGKYPDVIDGLQFERLLSASGPTAGQILRPSDGTVPKTVVFVECVGSRDPEKGIPYCSKICCMYTAKHALLYKHNVHDGQPIVFYMDIRAGGKGYEEFVQRAIEDESILYVRGRVARIFKDGNKMMVWGADTLTGKKVEVAADLVVLATAIQPSTTAIELAKKLKIPVDEFGFFSEAHPKLRPVETVSSGFYLAGVAQAPKDIPEAVAQASAAASKVAELFSKTELLHEPLVAGVDEDLCSGCAVCVPVCPYNARQLDAEKKTVKLTEVLCEGCGACTAACPSGAAQLKNLSDRQVEKMIEASLKD